MFLIVSAWYLWVTEKKFKGASFIADLIIFFNISTDREARPKGARVQSCDGQWDNVRTSPVLQERVSPGHMQLLGLNEGHQHIPVGLPKSSSLMVQSGCCKERGLEAPRAVVLFLCQHKYCSIIRFKLCFPRSLSLFFFLPGVLMIYWNTLETFVCWVEKRYIQVFSPFFKWIVCFCY